MRTSPAPRGWRLVCPNCRKTGGKHARDCESIAIPRIVTRTVRISRPCYDKMHRCPGWAGGGIRYGKTDHCPNGGYITYYTTAPDSDQVKRLWKWRLNQCPKCGVIVLPYVTRYLDPGWWWCWTIRSWWRDLEYWRKARHRNWPL
jgi:hypothetical protein